MDDNPIDETERQQALARLKKKMVGAGVILAALVFGLIVIGSEVMPRYRMHQKKEIYNQVVEALKSGDIWVDKGYSDPVRVQLGMSADSPAQFGLDIIKPEQTAESSLRKQLRCSAEVEAFSDNPAQLAIVRLNSLRGKIKVLSLKEGTLEVEFETEEIQGKRNLVSVKSFELGRDFTKWFDHHKQIRDVEEARIAAENARIKAEKDKVRKAEEAKASAEAARLEKAEQARIGEIRKPYEEVLTKIRIAQVWGGKRKPEGSWIYMGNDKMYLLDIDNKLMEFTMHAEPFREHSENLAEIKLKDPDGKWRGKMKIATFTAGVLNVNLELGNALEDRLESLAVIPNLGLIDLIKIQNKIENSKPVKFPSDGFDENKAIEMVSRYYAFGNSGNGPIDSEQSLRMIGKAGAWYYDKFQNWSDIKASSEDFDRKNPYRRYRIMDKINCVRQSDDGFCISLKFRADLGKSPDQSISVDKKGYVKVEPIDGNYYITRIASCKMDEDIPFPGWVLANYKTSISPADTRPLGNRFSSEKEHLIAIILQDRSNFHYGRGDTKDEESAWFATKPNSDYGPMREDRLKKLRLMTVAANGDKDKIKGGNALISVEVKFNEGMTITVIRDLSGY